MCDCQPHFVIVEDGSRQAKPDLGGATVVGPNAGKCEVNIFRFVMGNKSDISWLSTADLEEWSRLMRQRHMS